MKYRALGPISVQVEDHYVKLGGLRQQIVFAVLLQSANRVVSQDVLIDSVWAGDPPEAARATIQSYIYNLRRAMGSDAIVRRGDGYLVEVDAGNFDVLAFEERVVKGTEFLKSDPAAARELLLQSLAMWFGTAYGGIDHPELNVEIQRLGEMRVNATESRLEADLALGRDGELVGELEALVRDHPFRERFWGQLMLALYRAGRQAEALRAYQRARARLVDDLGIEPGVELQRLEQQILDQDPSLEIDVDPPTSTAGGGGGDSIRGSIRGYELRDVVGRGRLSTVYRAYQPSMAREVGIKVIQSSYANDHAFVVRFEREAQIVANLEHPHILPLHDYWRDPTGAYLVMPLMRGGSLDRALQAGGWGLEPGLRLVDQVGNALSHAHRRGVLHRDLKPGNVLLDEDGNAYLSDFGILSHVGEEEPALLVGTAPNAPEVAPGEGATVRSDIYALGVLTLQLFVGMAANSEDIPDRDEALPVIPTAMSAVIARATAPDPRERFASVDEYLRELRRAAGADVLPGSGVVETVAEIRNPYKGLRAFVEGDAVDFHGRSALIDDLLKRVDSSCLVTVVGPSGSGKSSLVRAGLIPALRAGGLRNSNEWLITDMFPGSHPFEELEAALSRVAVGGATGMLDELTQPNGLLRVSKQILPGEDSTLLVVIDQFEELFSTVRSEETRRRFLENLIAVADDERSRVRVVTTIRADFLDRPLAYANFAEAIAGGLITVGPPTRDGLARAVAAPARNVGLELEPGLVGQIIADVEGQPGALPLLQYALTEMFSHRELSTLTIAGYEATGGVAGALARRAEELYEGLTVGSQTAARQVFVRLVSVDESGAVTRRRARQSELTSIAVDQEALALTLQAFASFRLLTFDRDPVTRGPTVEVAHEALLTEWSRLCGWIEDARESLVLARRVAESAQEWSDSDRDDSYLLRGSRLEDIEMWSSNAEVVMTGDEARYLEASVAHRESEFEATRKRRMRAILALVGGFLLVGSLAVVAFAQRGVAQQQALEARVRELSAASATHVVQNPELALLIAVEAFDESIRNGGDPKPEAVSAIATAVARWRLVARYPAGRIVFPAAGADGSLIAVSSKDSPRDIMLFDSEGLLVGNLPGPEHPSVAAWAVAFNPDGGTIAVTYSAPEDDTFLPVPEGVPDVAIFDLTTLRAVKSLDTDRGWMDVSYSPDGALLALTGGRSVSVFDWDAGIEVSRFEASSLVGNPVFLGEDQVIVPVEGSGFTTFSIGDGLAVDHMQVANLNQAITSWNGSRSRIAYRAGDHIKVVDAGSGEVLFDLEAPSVLAVALDPNGTHLSYSGFDSNIHVVPLEGDEKQLLLSGTLENVESLVYVDSERLLSNGDDALLWNASEEGMDALGGIALAESQWGYQMSPDQRLLAYSVSTNNGGPLPGPEDGMRLVDIENQEETVLSRGEWESVVSGIRLVNPDFTMVGSLTQDGESTLRRLPDWSVVHEFDTCRAPLAIAPDNRFIILGGWGCGAEIPGDAPESAVVDLETGSTLLPIPYPYLFSAEFSPAGTPDGGRFVVATDQVTAQVWDMDTGKSLGSLHRSDRDEFGNLLAVTFDPTGRYVVGGTTGGTVWVADLERMVSGEDMVDALVFTRQAHTGAAPVPVMNVDGIVATAGFDGQIRLWDVDSGDLIFEFESDIDIPVVRFSPDGAYLLYPDGPSIQRMPVDPYLLRLRAQELLTRDFLPDECARYAAAEDRCDDLIG